MGQFCSCQNEALPGNNLESNFAAKENTREILNVNTGPNQDFLHSQISYEPDMNIKASQYQNTKQANPTANDFDIDDIEELEDKVRQFWLKLIKKRGKQLSQIRKNKLKKMIHESKTQGNMKLNTSSTLCPNTNYDFTGFKLHGRKEGYGFQKWFNDEKFFGMFKNGKKKGLGRFVAPNKKTYIGEMNNDQANGFGYLDIYNNSKFTGLFLNNRKVQGIETYNDESKYIGEFKGNMKHGFGEYYWANEAYYVGQWNNGNFEGFGIYKTRDKIYEGEFKNNKSYGYGEESTRNGHFYAGNWKEDMKDGFGVKYSLNSKTIFIGFHRHNVSMGPGKFLSENKEKYGSWKDNTDVNTYLNQREFLAGLNQTQKKYQRFFKMSYDDAKDWIHQSSSFRNLYDMK